MATDIVLSFYATPGPAQAPPDVVQPVSRFNDPPTVLSSNGIGGGEHTEPFNRMAEKLRNPRSKRLLPAVLSALRAPEPRRIAVVGFSAGRAMVQALLDHPLDRADIDTVIDIDGLHFQKDWKGSPISTLINPWVEFGKLCMDGTHLLVNFHTAIAPPRADITSTTQSNEALYSALWNVSQAVGSVRTQPYDWNEMLAGPPPPMVVTPAQDTAPRREWNEMPPMTLEAIGNCFNIGMGGNNAGDHIFACYWGQAAVWRTFFAPRWNDPEKYFCTGGPAVQGLGRLGALGSGEACTPKTTTADVAAIQEEIDLMGGSPLEGDGILDGTSGKVIAVGVGATLGYLALRALGGRS